MNPDQENIDKIRTAFEKMQTKDDFLNLLNEAKSLIYGKKANPFELRQLNYYSDPKLHSARYHEFKIRKKSGAERTIHAPFKGLKSLQKSLSFVLQCVYEPHTAAMGFVWGRSIVDNARKHAGALYVYNIDLTDFFPSIDQARVWKCLQIEPFNLNENTSVKTRYTKYEDVLKKNNIESLPFKKNNGRYFCETTSGPIIMAKNFANDKDKYIIWGNNIIKTKNGKSLKDTMWLVNKLPPMNRIKIANIIASMSCTEIEVTRKNETGDWKTVKRNVLPQGAPTSPVITNIVCKNLDRRLTGLAKRFGLQYSRYADDITFSSMHNIYQSGSDFKVELQRIITEQGFQINKSKTRLQKNGHRKEVTGLLVNENVNVQKRYIKQLRMWLYYWERYGYERATVIFFQQYLVDKCNIRKGKTDMANIIAGKLDYLKMVKGNEAELYLKLKARFDKLIGTRNPIDKILELWEKDGIEKAIDLFYDNNNLRT